MLKIILVVALVLYLLIGLAITAFAVHMAYHESAIGYGDDHDHKALRLLEGPLAIFGYLFLFLLWPVALLVTLARAPHAPPGSPAPDGDSSPQK